MPEMRATRTVIVTDPVGLHVRTALAVTEVVRRGQSEVTLAKSDQSGPAVAATDVLQILMLCVRQGEAVTAEAVGPDADAVLDLLEPLFAGVFGDEP